MNNPYEILGIDKNATEDEINIAYRNLVKKYHPDKYVGNPLADLASQKIIEINEAYDAIMEERKNGNSQNSNTGSSSSSTSNNGDEYAKIRQLIDENKLSQAQAMLNAIEVRDASWHFLTGLILKKKGWYDLAYQHFVRASMLDPSNMEYAQARDSMDFSGQTYRQFGSQTQYNSCCDGCQTLICADCCCEMCGGNLIPCIGCR